MILSDVTLHVRDIDDELQGQVDFEEINDFAAVPRFNNIGMWTFTLPVESLMAAKLRIPGSGILLSGPNDTVLISGPMISAIHSQDTEDPEGTILFVGACDNLPLGDAAAFPQPANPDVTTQNVGYDVYTDDGETVLRRLVDVNIGPSAHVDRRIQDITLAVNTHLGDDVTSRARFDNLGALMFDVASQAGGLGYEIRQVGTSRQLRIYQPVDRSSTVIMDIDNDNVRRTSYGFGAPTATRAIVAGQGEGVERKFVQRTTPESLAAEAEWNRKIEFFKDRRDTNEDDELNAEGDDIVNTQGSTIVSLSVIPNDVVNQEYGRDWFLGDIVGVDVDGVPLSATVTEAVILIDGEGLRIGATIGDPTGFDYDSKLVAQIKTVSKRVASLEKYLEVPYNKEETDELIALARAESNKIHNGDFRINQRVYTSGAQLLPGLLTGFGHDRWRAPGRCNLALNPTGITNTTFWAGANSTISRLTGLTIAGLPGVTTAIRGTQIAATTGGLYNQGDSASPYTLGVPFQTFRISAWLRSSVNKTIQPSIQVNNGSTTIFSGAVGSTVALVANVWTEVVMTYQLPVGAVRFGPYWYSTAAWAIGNTLDVAGLMISEGTDVVAYFDGAMAGCCWSGTANASPSVNRSVVPSYTFSQTPQGCVLTLPSDSGLMTVLERADMEVDDYIIGHYGTAPIRVYNYGSSPPAFSSSGLVSVSIDGTSDVIVEFDSSGGSHTIDRVFMLRGSSAYGFAPRPIQQELALCKRFYDRKTCDGAVSANFGMAQGVSTTVSVMQLVPSVPMRATPSLVDCSSAAHFVVGTNGVSGAVGTAICILPTRSSTSMVVAQFTAASGMTAGAAYMSIANATASAWIAMHAEVWT